MYNKLKENGIDTPTHIFVNRDDPNMPEYVLGSGIEMVVIALAMGMEMEMVVITSMIGKEVASVMGI